MKDQVNFAAIEFHRFLHWKNIAAWLIITTLLILQAHSAMTKYQLIPEKTKTFQHIQKNYFEKTSNYELYGRDGIKIIFVPAPTGILTNKAVVPDDLSAKVDNIVTVQIYNSYKGKSLEPGNWFGKPDIAGIIFWLISLFALWNGFRSYCSPAYLRCLASLRPGFTLYLKIILPRLLLFLAAFTCGMAVIYIYVRAGGMVFSDTDIASLWAALGSALVMLASFFVVGVIIAAFGQRTGSYIALIAAWAILTFALPWLIDSKAEPHFPDTTRDYQVEFNKYGKIMGFEDRVEKENGKFNRDKMDTARRVIEKYKAIEFPGINAVETGFKEEIRSAAQQYNNGCMWFPAGFFKITVHEVSSRGYLNYMAFYDYVQDMYRAFVWFYIDRTFYHDPKKLVNFIRGDESIFRGHSVLPENYGRCLALNLGYVLLLLFLAYIAFKRMVYAKAGKVAAFSHIDLDLRTRGITTITSGYKDFNRQIYNAFAGQAHGLPWKVSLDGISLLTGKRHDFLYIPNPAAFPPELKGSHVLGLFKGLLRIPPKQAAHIKETLGKKLLGKRLGKMHPGEKAKLMITLSLHCDKALYIYEDFPLDLYEDELKETREIMQKGLKPGTTVIDLVSPGRGWLLNYSHKYDIGFRDGVYGVFPRQTKESPPLDGNH